MQRYPRDLRDPTGSLLACIGMMDETPKDIGQLYGMALESTIPTDWDDVHAAILGRWSKRTLSRIQKIGKEFAS